MQAATPLSLIVLGVACGAGGLYAMLGAGDDSPDVVRWLGPTFVATALLPVLAILVNGHAWAGSVLNRWYWAGLFAVLIAGAMAAAVLAVTGRRHRQRTIGLCALWLCCAGICCFERAFLSALILTAGSGALVVFLTRRTEARPAQTVSSKARRPREPALACMMGAVLATTLVSAVHATVDPRFAQASTSLTGRRAQAVDSSGNNDGQPQVRDVRLAHHVLILAALIFAVGCVGISSRGEPSAIFVSAGVALTGIVAALTASGGLHNQPIGDSFAGLVLGVAATVLWLLRAKLFPLLVDTAHAGDATSVPPTGDTSHGLRAGGDPDG